jgi:hypothetical protein
MTKILVTEERRTILYHLVALEEAMEMSTEWLHVGGGGGGGGGDDDTTT